MNNVFSQVTTLWRRLTTVQKVAGAGILSLALAGGVAAVLVGGATEWRTLAAGVERPDAQKVLTKLDEAGVPYRLHRDGRDIDVPADRWAEVQRLVVQNDLLSASGGRGYASLNQSTLGQTEAQVKLRMRVMQEGELALSIQRFENVEKAGVHVTPAHRSWNSKDSRPAKASVMVHPRPGRMLTSGEVESIVQLVAHAVDGLAPDDVVVTDYRGMLLSRPMGAERSAMASRTREQEQYLQQKAESALTQVLGPHRAVVRVDVELDLERVDSTRDTVNPESRVVLSESQRSSENKAREARGVPSTAPIATSASTPSSTTEDIETRFDYERSRIRTVKEVGAIKRLTVGVMVDEALKDRGESVLGMVKGAVGVNPSRGDTIELAFVPFAPAEVPPVPPEPGFLESGLAFEIGKWSITGLLGAALVWLVLRSIHNARRNLRAALQRAEEERAQGLVREIDTREEFRRMVDQDVETVGKLLRNWLYEPVKH